MIIDSQVLQHEVLAELQHSVMPVGADDRLAYGLQLPGHEPGDLRKLSTGGKI